MKYDNLSEIDKKIAAKAWIAENVNVPNNEIPLKINSFFAILKKEDFNKWKKAVKEFYKALNIPYEQLVFTP